MERNYGLDWAKGLCMLWVICVLHLSQYLGDDFYLWYTKIGLNITYASLGTFSIIGGLLIGIKYNLKDANSICIFYKKRIFRFYPLFIIATLLLYLIDFNNGYTSIIGLLGLSPFVTEQPKTLWYISMMILFYLITPFVLNKKEYRHYVSVVVIIISIIYYTNYTLDNRFIYNLVLYLCGLCLANKIDFLIKVLSNILFFISIFFIYILALICVEYLDLSIKYSIIISCLGIPFILSLAFVTETCLNKKLINNIGYICLSFYLFHRFTFWLCLNIWQPNNVVVLALFLFFIALPIGAVFAYWMQKIYDRISVKFTSGDRIHSRRSPLKK